MMSGFVGKSDGLVKEAGDEDMVVGLIERAGKNGKKKSGGPIKRNGSE